MEKKNILFELMMTFLKIGLFTIGGGYAMISIIEDTCVEEKKWITSDDMMNITVIAESTPGPIALNCSTFVGYKRAGIAGSIFATLGMIIPSFVIIFIISMFLDNFLEYTIIANAFNGIKVAVGIIILRAGLKLRKKLAKNNLSRAIFICSTIAMFLINVFSWDFSTITMMFIAAVISFAVFVTTGYPHEEGGEKQ